MRNDIHIKNPESTRNIK